MFVVQALFDFSASILQPTPPNNQRGSSTPPAAKGTDEPESPLDQRKRKRSPQHDQELKREGADKDYEEGNPAQQQQAPIHYLTFQKGDKILVQQTLETGWWYGNLIKHPEQLGFFPSNYVKVGAKPPPPKPVEERPSSRDAEEGVSEGGEGVYEGEEGGDWLSKQLQEAEERGQKAVTSDYYQGIKGYKYVRINDNNKNILNANYVKFDVNTGLAKVPVKDQAPAAKAVRQMGYYFDYHQWNEDRNKNPESYRNKPDPTKKNKKKKLHLVGMGKDA